MKRVLIAPILFFSFIFAYAQNFEYKWEITKIDSTYDRAAGNPVYKIVEKYSAGMEDIMEIIAYSAEEMTKDRPQSGLSNLAADALMFAAAPFLREGDIAFSMTNFGGIRSDFPKGAIRVYDILSVFPFDNKLAIVDMTGKDLIKHFNKYAARNSFDALGNVEIVVKDKKYKKLLIAGQPIDPDKTYKLVTIDFLLGGTEPGDLKFIGKNIVVTDIMIRDAIIEYMKAEAAKGNTLKQAGDSRIIIEK